MSIFATDRRRFLRGAALGAGGLMLGSMFPKRALAQAATQRRFVFAYFDGGWDLLLGLDPRDPATTTAEAHQIQVGYDQLGGPYRQRGLQRRGALSFGPSVPPGLLAHADRLSIVNGIGMDTAAHEVARRYFITGRFPRGLTAVGSSTAAEIAAQLGDKSPIPHISAAVESYSTGLPSFAGALTVNSVADLIVALTPFAQIDPMVLNAVERYQDQTPGCGAQSLDREGLASKLLENQKRSRQYISSRLDQLFALERQDAQMVALRQLYGIVGGDSSQPSSPEVLSFVAGQALKEGVSQCVSVRVASGLDTHANWAQDHAPAQERGWRAVAALMSDLAAADLGDGSGQSVLDATTLVIFSEFGRTPMFNNLRGRDHHLGNSCIIGGAGIRGGRTIGLSTSVGMLPAFCELSSGQGVEMPSPERVERGEVVTLSPKHVLATALASAGLDPSYLRVDPIRGLL